MRSSLGYKAFIQAGTMSAKELYDDLERESKIGALERRLEEQ